MVVVGGGGGGEEEGGRRRGGVFQSNRGPKFHFHGKF